MEAQLYPIWYFAADPEKIALPDFKVMQDAANDMFPGEAGGIAGVGSGAARP